MGSGEQDIEGISFLNLLQYSDFVCKQSCLLTTSFLGSLIIPLAPGGSKTRDPGDEVGLLQVYALQVQFILLSVSLAVKHHQNKKVCFCMCILAWQ